jgi:hypothetical protein
MGWIKKSSEPGMCGELGPKLMDDNPELSLTINRARA